MLRLLVAIIGVAGAMNSSNTPTCSVNGVAGGQVVRFSDGTYDRCISLITPSSVKKPMPILWWFHGAGGNAAHCGNQRDLVDLATSVGFALICGEATQNIFGHGGEWNIPAKITDATGTPCSSSDSVEVNYIKNALAHLAQSPETYDTTRVFTSGCSMGSAFSGYIGNCLKKWEPQQISAFATHSTGLKKKGDGNHLPENWGECDGCQWWPFAPVKYTDSLGLKACVFDNTGDGDFYKTSKYLAKEWPQLGNPSESHFASGGHCQNIPYSSIVKCLGIGSSSPSPTPKPIAVAGAMTASNTPTCSVNSVAGGQVVRFSDGTYDRCISLITPSSVKKPMPILWWFHGAGGNAAHCGNQRDLVDLATSVGFALICGEATQNVFGHGGEWNIPAKITDATGTPCSSSDSVEVNYIKNALAHLAQSPETYDTTRVFTSGCSMGSAFSGYIGNCLKTWEPQQISAFATHSTGLKRKGDGNHLPENWGECDGCQWWPFAPVKYTDSLGLKACVFDNTGDGDFYKTSEYLAKEWPQLGNPSESHFASGGHCQNIPYSSIVKCLGIGGSSPSPTPRAEVLV